MSLLTNLRAQGVTITADGGRLLATPRESITENIRTTIRINKAALLREIAAEAEARHQAIGAARRAVPMLADYRHSLAAGTLVLCADCRHYQYAAEPGDVGHCTTFNVESAPFIPTDCKRHEGRAK